MNLAISEFPADFAEVIEMVAQDEQRYSEFKLKQWEDDGATFALPPGGGQLVEVESPPGRPLRRDDDYIVDGEVLRLLHPTTATVRALLVGPPARGFIERRPCALTLILSVRAKKRLDRLMESALAAALRASVDLPDLGGSVRLNARVRLRRPTAALVGITRAEDAGVRRPRCDIELLVRGELEMTVATGEADPAARIASVERSLTLPP